MSGALAVALGGALGALCRWAAAGWIQRVTGSPFPWGTLAVNVVGSALLGFILVWLQSTVASPESRQFLTVGLLGSFTTFSTFSFETVALIQGGEWPRAVAYGGGSLVLGLLAVLLGSGLATFLTLSR